MAIATLSLRGDKAVIRKLKALEPKIRKRVLTRAAKTVMRPVLAAARANAPKKTGRLAKSLKLRVLPKNRRGVVGVRVATSEKWFKGDTFYGAFQEFGWKTGKRTNAMRRKSNVEADNRKQVPGKHFVERAYEQLGGTALAGFMGEVRREINIIASGGK